MRLQVLPSNVGQAFLGRVFPALENQHHVAGMLTTSRPYPKSETELEGHVEARKLICYIQLDGRKIMDAVGRSLDKAGDLIHAHFTTIAFLEGGSRSKSTCENSENHGLEERSVVLRKRAIDEDARKGLPCPGVHDSALLQCLDGRAAEILSTHERTFSGKRHHRVANCCRTYRRSQDSPPDRKILNGKLHSFGCHAANYIDLPQDNVVVQRHRRSKAFTQYVVSKRSRTR